MMLHGWTGYVTHAWGQDELKPVSNTGRNWMGNGMSATIIDSLDTLYIMGLMEEYQEARDYVDTKLSFDMVS
jgi:mannosyl-oligosaccharide alpha-1,2-mannosidase